MCKRFTIWILTAVLTGSVFAQNSAIRPPSFDKNGRLITTAAQAQQDQENGILARGGYDPQAAQAAAAARTRQAASKNVPRIGNSNAPNPNAFSDRNIYRCKKGRADVYADEENKSKFSSCVLVRRGKSAAESNQPTPHAAPAVADPNLLPENTTPPQMKELPLPPEAVAEGAQNVKVLASDSVSAPCSGAILYKGSTYIFSENEPCPIPDSLFRSRRPIEAEPSYYTQGSIPPAAIESAPAAESNNQATTDQSSQ